MCGFSQRKLTNRYKITYVNSREQRSLQEEIFKNEAIPLRGKKYCVFLENESISRRVHREDKWKLHVKFKQRSNTANSPLEQSGAPGLNEKWQQQVSSSV